jgi:hypothetical protein
LGERSGARMQETTEQLELVVARCPYCELFTVKQITLTNHKTKRKMTHLCPTTRYMRRPRRSSLAAHRSTARPASV